MDINLKPCNSKLHSMRHMYADVSIAKSKTCRCSLKTFCAVPHQRLSHLLGAAMAALHKNPIMSRPRMLQQQRQQHKFHFTADEGSIDGGHAASFAEEDKEDDVEVMGGRD